jgi:hypothetical protein
VHDGPAAASDSTSAALARKNARRAFTVAVGITVGIYQNCALTDKVKSWRIDV